MPWPESQSAVRLLLRVTAGGTVTSEVVTDGGLGFIQDGHTTYLLGLRTEDLQALHPRAELTRVGELRVEPSHPICESGYDTDGDRVYGPVPPTALWHQLNLETAKFDPLTSLPEVLRGLRLSLPFSTDRSPPAHRLRSFGAETRVTADGWVADDRPRFVNVTDPFNEYHWIYDVQSLDQEHALVLQARRLFIFSRGDSPLSSDAELALLRAEPLSEESPPTEAPPNFDRTGWVFSSFVLLPGSTVSGARRVIVSSSTGEGAHRLSRISWLEVTPDPPSFRVVHSSTVAGGAGGFAGLVDVHGRALFVLESAREGIELRERRAIVLAGSEPPLQRVLPEPEPTAGVFSFVAPSPLPAFPHVVSFENGEVWLTDLSRPEGPVRKTTLPRAPPQGVASLATHLDASERLWMMLGGEDGAYFIFDPDREVWTELRFVTDPATSRARGCVAASGGEECALHRPGIELRDGFFHADPSGRLWTFIVPRVCPQVLTADQDGFLTGVPVTAASGVERAVERMRPGWSPRHKLLGTPLGELFELELE